MEPECKDILKVMLPAVRASVAEVLKKKYDYKQEEIAEKLGVVQVAVSKYLNSKHSKEISHMKNYIAEHKLNERIVDKIIRGGTRQEIDIAIDELCDSLIAYNLV